MKINRIELLNSLKRIKPIILSSTVLPVLEKIHMKWADKKLTISATDLELYITETVSAESSSPKDEKNNEWLMDFRWLFALILNSDSEFVYMVDDSEFTIECGTDIHFVTVDDKVENFPVPPSIMPSEITLSDVLKDKVLTDFKKNMLSAVRYISNDDLRPSITGACLQMEGDKITIAATDAHRLYFVDSGIVVTDKNKAFRSVILPKKICTFIAKNISSSDAMQLHVSDKRVFIETKQTAIYSRVIDARYPDWRKVIPETKVNLGFNRKQLTRILRCANALAFSYTKQIVFTCNKSSVKIKVESIDFVLAKSEFSIEAQREDISVLPAQSFQFGINAQFLLDSVADSKDAFVKISCTTEPTKALVLDDKILLMPLMIGDPQYS